MTQTIPGVAGEAAADRYARHTRNAVVLIAVLTTAAVLFGVVWSIIVGANLVHMARTVAPGPSPTCFSPADPATVGLPAC